MRSFVLATSALLVLAACTPQAPDGAAAPPPADAPPPPAAPPATSTPLPEAFTGGMDARGNEPFWGLQIRDTQITLQRPDYPVAVGPNPGLRMKDGKATWETQAGADRLAVTLSSEACSDGMSDLKYDFAAVVVIGSETLKGCASYAGAMPKEGA